MEDDYSNAGNVVLGFVAKNNERSQSKYLSSRSKERSKTNWTLNHWFNPRNQWLVIISLWINVEWISELFEWRIRESL